MSDRFESWFLARRRIKAIEMIQGQSKIMLQCVDELTRCVQAASDGSAPEAKAAAKRLEDKEHEGDILRKSIIEELAKANLPTHERTSLMRLVRQIDWVSDWALESTNILMEFQFGRMPETLRKLTIRMSKVVKDCAVNVVDCIEKLTAKQIQASLEAADRVERFEEEVDDLYRTARGELNKINDPNIGVGSVVLLAQFLDAIENVSDRCEDACDQARVIAVLHAQT
jgi:predicted phosphate transport protein (TIGR00153 family)